MSDMMEQAGEIQEALGRTYGLPDDIDESDLDAGNKHSSYMK
jgi:charged multivesicular body protein 5